MKKIRGNKPVGAIIHIYVEISQENTLCSYLQNFLIFYFSFKIRGDHSRTFSGEGGGEEMTGKG
jgi:hypothetical protein